MSFWTEKEITWVLDNRWKQLSRQVSANSVEVDWIGFQREVETGLARRMRRELQVEPLILCLVQPAPAGTPVYKGRTDDEFVPKGNSKNRELSSGAKAKPVHKSAPPSVEATKTVSASRSLTNAEKQSIEDAPTGRTRRRRSAVN